MAVCTPTLPPALVPLPICQAAASSRTGHGRGRISRLLGEGRNLTWWGQGLRPIWMLWLGIPMALDTLIHTQAHRQAYKHSGHEVERYLTFCFVFEPYDIVLAGPKFPGSNVHTLAYQEAGREGTCPQAFSKIHFFLPMLDSVHSSASTLHLLCMAWRFFWLQTSRHQPLGVDRLTRTQKH